MDCGPSVRVQDVPGRGRGLFTTRDVAAGEVVIAERPLLLVVAEKFKTSVCATCGRLAGRDGAIVCTSCKRACFCSHLCQQKGQLMHASHNKVVCSYFAAANWNGMSEEQQDTLRFLIQAAALKIAGTHNADATALYEGLTHLCRGRANTPQEDDLYRRLCQAMDGPLALTKEEAYGLMQKEMPNAYGVMMPEGDANQNAREAVSEDAERQVRGSGFYLLSSMINHECLPNVARCDDFDSNQDNNTFMVFKALHNLPAGTEVVQSYFPMNWDFEDRQQQCKSVYGFECSCPRCQVEAAGSDPTEDMDVDAMEGNGHGVDSSNVDVTYIHLFLLKHLCPVRGCGGTMIPQIGTSTGCCNVCGELLTEQQFLQFLEQGLSTEEEE
eukprot:evm.model.scf_3553.1 EVM.evm.TU.scf_3553.1   scf_3553:1881-7957(-)